MLKKELKSIIDEEKILYTGANYRYQKATLSKRYLIWRYLSYYRVSQYYREKMQNVSGLNKYIIKLAYRYYVKKKNSYSYKSGVEIANNRLLGRRLDIWHSDVVINCHLGNDCVFHGHNIVGNKGLSKADEIPILGNNIDIGAGAVLIGNIRIADNCVIGSNAVVTKDVTTPGVTIVGVPGRRIDSPH